MRQNTMMLYCHSLNTTIKLFKKSVSKQNVFLFQHKPGLETPRDKDAGEPDGEASEIRCED